MSEHDDHRPERLTFSGQLLALAIIEELRASGKKLSELTRDELEALSEKLVPRVRLLDVKRHTL